MEVLKETLALFLYIACWLSVLLLLLPALPCFRKGTGRRLETGGPQILLSPSWPGVFSQQRATFCESFSWFLVWTQHNTSVTKTDLCSVTHLEYREALIAGSSSNYNGLKKKKKEQTNSLCWICACILKDNRDQRWKPWRNQTKRERQVRCSLLLCFLIVKEWFSMSYKEGRERRNGHERLVPSQLHAQTSRLASTLLCTHTQIHVQPHTHPVIQTHAWRCNLSVHAPLQGDWLFWPAGQNPGWMLSLGTNSRALSFSAPQSTRRSLFQKIPLSRRRTHCFLWPQ